jgi:hypothetical protein
MKYSNHNKIKMEGRVRGKKPDKAYNEFFKDEVDAVIYKIKKPDILPSLIKRKK